MVRSIARSRRAQQPGLYGAGGVQLRRDSANVCASRLISPTWTWPTPVAQWIVFAYGSGESRRIGWRSRGHRGVRADCGIHARGAVRARCAHGRSYGRAAIRSHREHFSGLSVATAVCTRTTTGCCTPLAREYGLQGGDTARDTRTNRDVSVRCDGTAFGPRSRQAQGRPRRRGMDHQRARCAAHWLDPH